MRLQGARNGKTGGGRRARLQGTKSGKKRGGPRDEGRGMRSGKQRKKEEGLGRRAEGNVLTIPLCKVLRLLIRLTSNRVSGLSR